MYRNKNFISYCTENKFSSPTKIILNYDYKPLINLMKKKKIFLKGNSKFILESAKTKEIDIIANHFFKKKLSWKIIKNKSEVKNWIIKLKKREIKENYLF